MQKKSIQEINQLYELEILKIVKTIKAQKLPREGGWDKLNVLLQFPDGMSHYAQTIANEIESKTNCNCMIWLDSCFGACDIPIETKNIVDLIIQVGHSKWNFKNNKYTKKIISF